MQPFKEIRAIEHPVAPGVTARCLMTGDVFEMEDQRNWSDASYKTYVRPLALPWPYVMESGVRNHQSVELLITDSSAGAAKSADAKPDAADPSGNQRAGRHLSADRGRHPSR